MTVFTVISYSRYRPAYIPDRHGKRQSPIVGFAAIFICRSFHILPYKQIIRKEGQCPDGIAIVALSAKRVASYKFYSFNKKIIRTSFP